MKICVFFSLALLMPAFAVIAGPPEPVYLDIYTEQMPPMNYEDPQTGEPIGFSVEIVQELLRRTRILPLGGRIKLYPWARAFKIVEREKNSLLFSTTRTNDRENLFVWVGPIAERTIWLWKLTSRNDIQVERLEDAKKYTIAGIKGYASSEQLIELGFNVELAANIDQNWKKLFAGRVDLATAIELDVAYHMKRYGKSLNDLKRLVKVEDRFQYYLAVNKQTDKEIVNRLQEALDSMKADGSFSRIRNSYLK